MTHIVYPFGPKGDPDDGQEYLRCLEKRCIALATLPSFLDSCQIPTCRRAAASGGCLLALMMSVPVRSVLRMRCDACTGAPPPWCTTGTTRTAMTGAFQRRWHLRSLNRTSASEAGISLCSHRPLLLHGEVCLDVYHHPGSHDAEPSAAPCSACDDILQLASGWCSCCAWLCRSVEGQPPVGSGL